MMYKILTDYPGYEIYDNGEIFYFSTKKGWLKPGLTKDGSYDLNLRSSDGSRNASSKISEWQVKAISFFYKHYSYKQTQLSKIYGITQAQVSSIILRKSWYHV